MGIHYQAMPCGIGLFIPTDQSVFIKSRFIPLTDLAGITRCVDIGKKYL